MPLSPAVQLLPPRAATQVWCTATSWAAWARPENAASHPMTTRLTKTNFEERKYRYPAMQTSSVKAIPLALPSLANGSDCGDLVVRGSKMSGNRARGVHRSASVVRMLKNVHRGGGDSGAVRIRFVGAEDRIRSPKIVNDVDSGE